MVRNVLILAGGGGHTGYGYALAQRLYGKTHMYFLVPEGDFLSVERLSRFGSVGFLPKARGPKTPMKDFIFRFFKALFKASGNVSRDFDVVISTGSNFCVPPAIFAYLKGIPLINIESSVRFTKASKTARFLEPFSIITALQWEEQKRLLSKGIVVGPLLPKPEIEPWNGGYILVTGGTLGHKMLFDIIAESSLKNVVLQTGLINPEPYRRRHPEWKVIEYSSRFHELIAGAELVITHFGSTALESIIYKKPVVMVLNPEWKRTVGKSDAEIFAEKINATFVWDLKLASLLKAIEEARNKKLPILEDGAENLAKEILRL